MSKFYYYNLRLFIFPSFLLIGILSVHAQTLNDSLKAHFKFEGNLSDSSTLGGDLTTLDATRYKSYCADDSTLEFDGNLRLESINAFDNSAYTETAISLWFKTSTINNSRQIILEGSRVGFGVIIGGISGNMGVWFDGTSAGALTTVNSVADGKWHHLLAQNNGSKTFMYIDTIFIDSIVDPLYNGTGLSNNILYLGKTRLNLNPYTGFLNEIRIYNRLLTKSEITQLFNITNDAFIDSTEFITSCDTSYFWSQTGITYFNSGIYKDTVSSVTKCDSIFILDLTINKPSDTSLSITDCDSFTWLQTGITYTASGTFMDTVLNLAGCDSIISLELTIISHDTTATLSGDTLTVSETGLSYQWLDCDSNFAVIGGADSPVFIPSRNGNYACEISSGNCVDTTNCISALITGVEEQLYFGEIKIYPNPFYDQLIVNIENAPLEKEIEVELLSITGQRVYSKTFDHSSTRTSMKMNEVPKGIYFLKLTQDDSVLVRKLIKN